MWILFSIIIVGFLVIDLGYLNRKAHIISFRSALIQSAFWVVISLIFSVFIFVFYGTEQGAQFLSAYVTEKMLSTDNLFVMLLIFAYFKIDQKYHHRVLFYGILGVVILRGVFIGLGAAIVSNFHWVLYVFGALLVYTGIKMLFSDADNEPDFKNNRVVKFSKRFLKFTDNESGGKFFIKEKGKPCFTVLFLALLVIETTDVLFAIDSIPAVFSITQSPFIAFTSNIFAVMGLRSLFFVVEGLLKKFHLLEKGVSFVLIFIGGKMLVDIFGIHIPATLSLLVILVILVLSLFLSKIIKKNEN